jgi:type I restriction enzyme S subunit
MKRFPDLCVCVNDQCNPATSGASVYVGLEHITGGAFFLTRHGKPSDVQSAKSRFQKGDILYGKLRPYLDKAVIAPGNGICSTDILVFRPKPDACGTYLLGLIHSAEFRTHADQTTNGVNHPRTSWNGLAGFSRDVPQKPEQEKIAAVLWKVQRAIEVEEKLVAAARELKQSAMRQLFTHGLRNEPQKETEIGLLPKSWMPTPAAQIFKLTSGSKRPADLSPIATPEKPYPVLGGNGVMGYSSEWFLDTKECLVIGRVGEYCGAVHLVRGKVWITDNALYAKEWLNDSIRVDYLAGYLDYYDLNRFKRAAGQPLVTQGLISEHTFPIPSPDEQREIAGILKTLDQKISVHERKRGALGDLFQTLLYQLMTAQIRVHRLDIDTSEVKAA